MNHLQLLNAFLALRFRQPGWPCVLMEAGYQIHGVGAGLTLEDGGKTVPDVLALCVERNVTLIVEVKSGANLSYDQLGRMERLTPSTLRDLNHLTIRNIQHHKIPGCIFLQPGAPCPPLQQSGRPECHHHWVRRLPLRRRWSPAGGRASGAITWPGVRRSGSPGAQHHPV